jgi:hypothetical protein
MALAVNVPEGLRKLQPGHTSSSWKAYKANNTHGQLYHFFTAFGIKTRAKK